MGKNGDFLKALKAREQIKASRKKLGVGARQVQPGTMRRRGKKVRSKSVEQNDESKELGMGDGRRPVVSEPTSEFVYGARR